METIHLEPGPVLLPLLSPITHWPFPGHKVLKGQGKG